MNAKAGRIWLLSALLSFFVFGPLLRRIVYEPFGDHATHMHFASEFFKPSAKRSGHFLYHLLTASLEKAFPVLNLLDTGFLVSWGAMAGTLVALCWFLTRRSSPDTRPVRTAAIAFSLLLVWPVNLVTLPNMNIYAGYVAPNTFHNPTILMLKPIAVLLFGLLALSLERPVSRRRQAALALLTILSALAKPNLLVVLLPSVVAWSLFRHRWTNHRVVYLGVVVPGIVVLGWQYVHVFGNSSGGIVFAPLLVMRHFSDHLFLKWIASILFPAAVALLFFRRTRQSTAAMLAWLIFAVACLLAYGFAESGPRLWHGNLGWGTQIALFLLMAASVEVLLDPSERDSERVKKTVCWGIYGLHLACGVIAYFIHFTHRFKS